MMKLTGMTALVMATAALSACETQNDNQASANEPGVEANVAADTSMTMSGPFAESEMRMDRDMMAAVGSDVGQTWLKKMIVHHQGALDMSRIVLDRNPTADVAKMARDTITNQGREIEDLRRLVVEGPANRASADLFAPSMMDMHAKMMAATGSDISDTFLRKMLEHHRGAVTMSDAALANGVSGAIRSQVQKTRAAQQEEIAMVEAMLRGEPMPATTPASVPIPAPAPAPKAKAEQPAPRKQEAQPKPTAAAESKPAESSCLPEHRAMGHC